MEIRLSRYNLPFVEYPIPGVYFIPKDFQRQMALGLYDAHVSLFRSLPKSNLFEVYNPLTGENHVFDLDNDHYFPPYARNPISLNPPIDEFLFLNELSSKGIKAASSALGKFSPRPKPKKLTQSEIDYENQVLSSFLCK